MDIVPSQTTLYNGTADHGGAVPPRQSQFFWIQFLRQVEKHVCTSPDHMRSLEELGGLGIVFFRGCM